MKKRIALILAAVLLLGIAVGATIAWFTDQTEVITNTFTVGNIDIKLDEDDNTKDDETRTSVGNTYKMIPGWTLDKDPVVTVEAGSEDAWVFIKVDESTNLDDYIVYAIDEANWTALDETKYPGVYYCYAMDITADREIKILGPGSYEDTYTWGNHQVLVKPTVTKEMMDAVTAENYPKLSITAYACQYWKGNTTAFTALEAWKNLENPEFVSADNEATNVLTNGD